MAKPALADVQRPTDNRAAQILARSLFRDMRANGYYNQQILALATELIDQVTRDMRGEGEAAPSASPRAPVRTPDVELKIVSQPA